MEEYEKLIDNYRVDISNKASLSDICAYSFGLFLFISPFISGINKVMAIFSLVYFYIIFSGLYLWDSSKFFKLLFIEAFSCLKKYQKVISAKLVSYLELLYKSSKNSFAFIITRPR